MPDEDGFAFIGKVRKLSAEQGGNVPAIALTAMPEWKTVFNRFVQVFRCTSQNRLNLRERSLWANLTGRMGTQSEVGYSS
jgi:hypothetical protein